MHARLGLGKHRLVLGRYLVGAAGVAHVVAVAASMSLGASACDLIAARLP